MLESQVLLNAELDKEVTVKNLLQLLSCSQIPNLRIIQIVERDTTRIRWTFNHAYE
ncbi:MAG: hypothetical protein RMY33_017020 [Nostoc sp. DedQUE03]|nr:hypothetical protein [Nostoc sp. DedQUE02]